jgi:hypothetical protein
MAAIAKAVVAIAKAVWPYSHGGNGGNSNKGVIGWQQ